MSSPAAPRVVVTKTGEKFPPHGYDPNAPPGSVVVNATRRNGQIRVTRRAGKPIAVSSRGSRGRGHLAARPLVGHWPLDGRWRGQCASVSLRRHSSDTSRRPISMEFSATVHRSLRSA